MLARALTPALRRLLASSPAVALVGPRQAGKTTLARSLRGRYFDLEQEEDRLRLDLEWPDLVRSRDLVILDEAQAAPEVFPRLRGAIDEDRRRRGRFLLLGSVSPTLMTEVSESLAGRLSLLEITPLILSELETAASKRRLWLMGGYPDGGVLTPRTFPRWQDDYLRLLIQRDLPAWGLPARPQTTSRFVEMLAAVHGQIWNASGLAKSLGLSYHTVDGYLDYLVGAFLVRRLPSYHANLRKRLVKSPKVYWRDTGLLHSMLGATDQRSLLAKPWVGASWEGFVIEQLLGLLSALDRRHRAFHFRSSDGKEIDLLLDVAGELWAIETKLTTSPSQRDLARLDAVADLVGARRRFLVSQTREPAGDTRRGSVDLESFLDLVTRETAAVGSSPTS